MSVPQRTWSRTRPPWRSATRRWDATSPSSPTPTTLPTRSCRRAIQRTWTRLWARCRSSTTDCPRALGARTSLLPQTKTSTKPWPCSSLHLRHRAKPSSPQAGHPFSILNPLSSQVVSSLTWRSALTGAEPNATRVIPF